MRPPEEVKREFVRQWVAKAASHLGVARHLLSDGSPYVEVICFHAQQAAEKYLKAFLVERQIEFPKTHDLGALLDLVATTDPRLAESLRDVTALTPYGVDVRYPSDLPEITAEDAREAVELARRLEDVIRSVLRGG